MDKVDRYRQLICSLLTQRASLRSPNEPVKSQTVFDKESDRYLLIHVGWRDSVTRIYGCIIQVDIIGDKIWVQYDGTEYAIADELVEMAFPNTISYSPIFRPICASLRNLL